MLTINKEPLSNTQLREKLKQDLAKVQDFMLDYMNHPELDMSYKIFLSRPEKNESSRYNMEVLNYLDNYDLIQFLKIFIQGICTQFGTHITINMVLKILSEMIKQEESEDDR